MSIITLAKPLVPPVPVLHYIEQREVGPQFDWRTNPLPQAQVAGVLSNAVARYNAELPNNGNNEVRTLRVTMDAYPELTRINPADVEDGDAAVVLFPYDQRLRGGWFWTYAAMLKMKNDQEIEIYSTLGVCDPELLDLICLMMAHRPSLRPSLKTLKLAASMSTSITVKKKRIAAQKDTTGTRKRDADHYTRSYAQAQFELLYKGVTPPKHRFPAGGNHIIPFSNEVAGDIIRWDDYESELSE